MLPFVSIRWPSWQSPRSLFSLLVLLPSNRDVIARIKQLVIATNETEYELDDDGGRTRQIAAGLAREVSSSHAIEARPSFVGTLAKG